MTRIIDRMFLQLTNSRNIHLYFIYSYGIHCCVRDYNALYLSFNSHSNNRDITDIEDAENYLLYLKKSASSVQYLRFINLCIYGGIVSCSFSDCQYIAFLQRITPRLSLQTLLHIIPGGKES